jgi:predicted nucleic acid-binding protein
VPAKRIVDTSPLVFLARVDLLEILREGSAEVLVPEPVVEELYGHGPDDPTVLAIRRATWLTITAAPAVPPEVAAWDLGPGESGVLTLALAEPGTLAVIDDLEARRCARSLSIPLIGTLGLVLLAKQIGRIPAARPVVERLLGSGMYLSSLVVDGALARVGE